jgi:hypothetical protein
MRKPKKGILRKFPGAMQEAFTGHERTKVEECHKETNK